MKEIITKLIKIQAALKAPKNQRNTFGGYNYRSCEDILEAVKPLCAENGCALVLTDEIEQIGDRFYVHAMAVLYDSESGDTISNGAYSREPLTKKGMDDSQITGTASSYARKYALNGLFCIDDTKDADTNEYQITQDKAASKAKAKAKPEPEQPAPILCKQCGKPIEGSTNSNGKTFSPAQIAQYTGGLCKACHEGAKK